MAGAKIIMYCADWCGYCARARRLLDAKGVVYEEIDVDVVAGAQAQMQARTGRTSIPQIFINDQHVGGCEELHALEADGRLDFLLKVTEP
jgi:glutaredoxin 3